MRISILLLGSVFFVSFHLISSRVVQHNSSIILDSPGTNEERPRAVYAGNPGNYTLAFVPLFSLIANFIPRIMNRISPVQHLGRSLSGNPGIDAMSKPCSDLKLGRWPYQGDPCLFYTCYLNDQINEQCLSKIIKDKTAETELEKYTIGRELPGIQVNDCINYKIQSCARGYKFDPDKKLCVQQEPSDNEC